MQIFRRVNLQFDIKKPDNNSHVITWHIYPIAELCSFFFLLMRQLDVIVYFSCKV